VKGVAFQVEEGIRRDLLYQSFMDIDKEKFSFWVFDFIKCLDFYYSYFIVVIGEIIINVNSYPINQIKFQK
jgi:hypothetical protein